MSDAAHAAAFATLRERFPDKSDDEIRAAIAAASKAKTQKKKTTTKKAAAAPIDVSDGPAAEDAGGAKPTSAAATKPASSASVPTAPPSTSPAASPVPEKNHDAEWKQSARRRRTPHNNAQTHTHASVPACRFRRDP